LLWTIAVAYIGLFTALRRRALEDSPFVALVALIDGERSPWEFGISPVEVLFAEGFSWPGKMNRSTLSFYPVTLSLIILFPVLVSGIYLLHRLLSMGIGS